MDASGEIASVAEAGPEPFDLDAVFHAQFPRIVRAATRIVRDRARAEDLAIEAFWRLSRTAEAQGDGCAGWLYRTTVHLALDELRRRARRARYERALSWLVSASPDTPDDLFSATEEQGRVRAVLASLAKRDAELLVLNGDGCSYKELAAALGLNPASVGTLLNRARQAFRQTYVRRYGERS